MGATVQTLAGRQLAVRAGITVTARPGLTTAAVMAADVLALLLSGWLALAIWGAVNHAFPREPYLRLWPLIAIFLAAYAARGLYPGVGLSPVEELRGLVAATTAVCLVGSAFIFLSREASFSRGFLLGVWGLSAVLAPLGRAGMRGLFARRPWWGAPVVVLGAGRTGLGMVAALKSQPGLGLKPVALLDDDQDKAPECEETPLAGPLSLAPFIAERLRVRHALVAMPELSREQLLRVVEDNGAIFRHVIVLPDLFGMASLWVSARDVGGALGLEVRQNLLSPLNRCLKRGLDLLVACAACVLAAPVVVLAALWIKRVSPGPALFSQERGGKGGRVIRVRKLRTMYSNAEELLERHLAARPEARQEWEQFFKLRDDPRLLPGIGRLLRRTSLDELPQLWNVLKGEMSLVGPRPLPAYHLERFDGEFRALRARVPPGITGLWQAAARSDGDIGVQRAMDSYYIRNWSLWLDLYILARTVCAVLLRRGAY